MVRKKEKKDRTVKQANEEVKVIALVRVLAHRLNEIHSVMTTTSRS